MSSLARYTVFPLVSALFLLVSACGGKSSSEGEPSYWNPLPTDIHIQRPAFDHKNECDEFTKNIPPDYTQGYVTVPENWQSPASGPAIKVFYYGKLSSDARH